MDKSTRNPILVTNDSFLQLYETRHKPNEITNQQIIYGNHPKYLASNSSKLISHLHSLQHVFANYLFGNWASDPCASVSITCKSWIF